MNPIMYYVMHLAVQLFTLGVLMALDLDPEAPEKPNRPGYVRRLFGTALVVSGAFFLAEHIYNNGFEVKDIIGHEYLGLLMILGGIGMNLNWRKPKPTSEVLKQD